MTGKEYFKKLSSLNNSDLNSYINYSKDEMNNKNVQITKTIEIFKAKKASYFGGINDDLNLYDLLFDKNRFNKTKLKKHIKEGEKLFDSFIVYHRVMTDDDLKTKLLNEYYTLNNLKKGALNTNTKLNNNLKKKKLNIKNYYEQYKIDENKFEIFSNKFDDDSYDLLKSALDNLNKYYFLEKISLIQQLQSVSLMNNKKYDFALVNEIKAEIKGNKSISDLLLFKIYTITFELYTGNYDIDQYLILKDLITKNMDKFDMVTKSSLFTHLGNYLSILYSKSNDNNLLTEVFENYKRQINYKTIYKNGEIPDTNFLQIIRIAIYLKEFDWIKEFVKVNEKFLLNKDLLLVSKAEIEFSQQNYDTVLGLLNKVELKTVKLNYELKSLLAKTLYKSNEFGLLENHLQTFENYLRRQSKINDSIKKYNLLFVQFFKRLLSNKVHLKNLQKLKKEIEEVNYFFNKNWVYAEVNLSISMLK